MSKTKMFLIDYLNRKIGANSKYELAREIVSVGFNKFRFEPLCNLGSEYEDLLIQFDKIRNYVFGDALTIPEIQMILARFARELATSDLEVDLIHELNDDSWALIETLDYVQSLEEI